jgi:hypothetical protein
MIVGDHPPTGSKHAEGSDVPRGDARGRGVGGDGVHRIGGASELTHRPAVGKIAKQKSMKGDVKGDGKGTLHICSIIGNLLSLCRANPAWTPRAFSTM